MRSLKARGFDDLTTLPGALSGLEEAEDPRPSNVRIFTLLNDLVGVVTGFGIQIWMSRTGRSRSPARTTPPSRPCGSVR